MRFNEVKKLIKESEDLLEINMSPSSLEKTARQIDARAGMEFEMIVSDAENDNDDDFESEPDYEYDESVTSIQDAVQFFHDGEHNGRRSVQRLEDNMRENYEEWAREQFDEYWADNVFELIRDYLTLNANAQDIIEILDLEGTEAEELEENDPTKQDYRRAAERVIDDSNSSSWYDAAFDDAQSEFINGSSELEERWLESEGIETMQDVQEHYDIEWPHWTENQGNGGQSVTDIGDDFGSAVGRPWKASSGYHSGSIQRQGKESNYYIIEPDGSLDPDDSSDAGLEFVSPPLTLDEMFKDLDKVKSWAERRGCYTNSSTGLHINVSVPGYDLNNLDYIKLALLLGDKYVLDLFQRSGNQYCKSAMDEVKKRVAQRPEDAGSLLQSMKAGLGKLATKAIHSGVTSKYTSINTKDNRIEFRSPGGDWLSEPFFSQIKPTMMRFIVAMDAALDPDKYREEYLKKLYTLLQPKSKTDTLSYFARYAAGELPRSALKSFVRQAQLERRVAKDPTGGQQYWWNVEWTNGRRMEVVAGSKEVAKQVAAEEWGVPDTSLYNATVTPIRPYDQSPVRARVGEPQAIGQQSGEYTYRAFNIHTNQTIGTFQAGAPGTGSAAQAFAELIAREGVRERDADYQEIGRERNPAQPQPPLGGQNFPRARPNMGTQEEMQSRLGWPDQTGDANYEIVRRDNMTTVFVFIANTDQDAARKYSDWLSAAGYPQDTENFGFRRIGSSQQREFGQRAYYVIRNIDRGYNTASIEADTQDQAIRQFRQRIANDRDSFELLDSNGRIITTSTDQRGQAQQRPLSGGREFAGWKIVDGQGNELYSFSGAGNSQSDANRIAMQWISQQREQGRAFNNIRELEVVPVWREA